MNISDQIKSFVIGFALTNLCQTLVDAIVTPLITLVLKLLHFNEDYFNQYYSKLGELIRAVITFLIVFFGVQYFSSQSNNTDNDNENSKIKRKNNKYE